MSRKIQIVPYTDALVHIDVQPTFMPGGGLAVKDGDAILPVVRKVYGKFESIALPAMQERRYATLDRHPYGHISLASSYVGLEPYTELNERMITGWTTGPDGLCPNLAEWAQFRLRHLHKYLRRVGKQTLWPDHAIEGTEEAQLHDDFSPSDFYRPPFMKGLDPRCDSYSAFRDNLKRPTGFGKELRQDNIQRVFFTGLAFDFCVGFSALDAVDEGFREVFIIEDATRSVNLPGTVDAMRDKLAVKGVRVIPSSDLIAIPDGFTER